ncbi:MAG TPA: ATP-binding protein [Acidimicrobiales bacterium]|nr:ATP-binding protein [Acidimicrobiales bacterium]
MAEQTAGSNPASNAELDAIVLGHAYDGVRLQLLLRGLLVAFVVLTVTLLPPEHHKKWAYLIAAIYGLWAIGVAAWTERGRPGSVRFAWWALFVDVLGLGALTVMAGVGDTQSWTADVLVNGFFVIPLLATTQLQPRVCAAVVVPTVAVYFAVSVVTQSSNAEPWASILLRTLALAGLGAGCVALTRIQQSRMTTIGRLLGDRTSLLAELITVEDQQRRQLAEDLHDGALQYVLAARQDVEDVVTDPRALARLDEALTESSRLLRSTVSELHPAVLERMGLAQALRDLARTSEARGGFSVTLELDGWEDGVRTRADTLLYSTARELLTNIVKHARARTVQINLGRSGEVAHLEIADDGCGIPDGAVEKSLEDGHIGLASHRVRLEAAGGGLSMASAQPSGTVIRVDLPCDPTAAGVGA